MTSNFNIKKRIFQVAQYKQIGFLILLYSLIYACYTFPTIIDFTTRIIGKNDAYGVLWNTYVFRTGIHSGKIWTTQQAFYPWGTSLIYHASTPFIGLLSLLFENKIALLNILIYTMFVISAIGGYWLAKQFVSNNYFAIICGFVFAFSPYKMARIEEHYPLILTAVIPFFFGIFLKTFSCDSFIVFPKIRSKKYVVLLTMLGVFGLCLDYVVTFQMAYLCVLFYLFFYVYKLFQSSKKLLFWTGVGSVFVAMHFIIVWLIHHGVDDKGGLWWGGKWVDFIAPYNAKLYPHLGLQLMALFHVQTQCIESDMFLGYTLIIFLVISFIALLFIKDVDIKIKAMLFSLFMLFMIVMPVVSLPFLPSIYPPTAILHFLPIIKNLRCPTRFINDIMLVAPIIIFYILEKSSFTKLNKTIFATVIFIMLFAEYFPTKYSYIDYKSVPRVYTYLSKKPGESVLVYPLGLRDGFKLEGRFDIETMQYQTVYKKKTMGGYISRLNDWIWYVHYQNAFTNSLLQLEKDSTYSIPNADYASALKILKLDYVVIPKQYKNEKAAAFLLSVIKPITSSVEIIDGDMLIQLVR